MFLKQIFYIHHSAHKILQDFLCQNAFQLYVFLFFYIFIVKNNGNTIKLRHMYQLFYNLAQRPLLICTIQFFVTFKRSFKSYATKSCHRVQSLYADFYTFSASSLFGCFFFCRGLFFFCLFFFEPPFLFNCLSLKGLFLSFAVSSAPLFTFGSWPPRDPLTSRQIKIKISLNKCIKTYSPQVHQKSHQCKEQRRTNLVLALVLGSDLIKCLKKDELTLPEIFSSGFCSVVSSFFFSGFSFPVLPMQMFRDKNNLILRDYFTRQELGKKFHDNSQFRSY